MQDIYLDLWFYDGDQVRLIYKDGSEFLISRDIFNHSFQCIITISKREFIRDFKSRGIKVCG